MAATEKAILAGGCFWGVQDLIRKLDGVSGTRVGYTGGETPNATYRNHGSHAEAVEIRFDPGRISYRDLLEFFFQVHDPTTKNRQGNDVGASYRSAIYYRCATSSKLPWPASSETVSQHSLLNSRNETRRQSRRSFNA